MPTTPQDSFRLPVQATAAGIDFFYSSWQARGLLSEFANALNSLDIVRQMLFFIVFTHDSEHYQATLAENYEGMLTELKQKGYTHGEAEEILSNPARIAQLLREESRHAGKVLSEHEQFILQMLITRAYDSFDRYSEELVRTIYLHWPSGINGENVSAEEVSKRLQRITGTGTKAARGEALRSKFDLDWLSMKKDVEAETRIMAIRRIITHNRAVIDERFVDNVSTFTDYSVADIGQEILLKPQQVFADIAFLHEEVLTIDAEAAQKYKLPLIPVPAMSPNTE